MYRVVGLVDIVLPRLPLLAPLPPLLETMRPTLPLRLALLLAPLPPPHAGRFSPLSNCDGLLRVLLSVLGVRGSHAACS